MDNINYDNYIFDHNLLSFRSRLNKEFDILSWLGKGAFGDVFKVYKFDNIVDVNLIN